MIDQFSRFIEMRGLFGDPEARWSATYVIALSVGSTLGGLAYRFTFEIFLPVSEIIDTSLCSASRCRIRFRYSKLTI